MYKLSPVSQKSKQRQWFPMVLAYFFFFIHITPFVFILMMFCDKHSSR